MAKIRVGITGQSGFLGTHLFNTLGLYYNEFDRIYFDDEYFEDIDQLGNFVKNCDVIVHLSAVNRHSNDDELYRINISLVNTLIEALKKEKVVPHVIFSSSIQEHLDNMYGRSKREGRQLFERWASACHASFTGLIIPNIYGPFGIPNYNSFIATFCSQLINGKEPKIIQDNNVNLIYVSSLCKFIIADIVGIYRVGQKSIKAITVPADVNYKVSEILNKLNVFKRQYFDNGIIPVLNNENHINLFNTFRSYMDIEKVYPRFLNQNVDSRGIFVETLRLGIGGQVSFSVTKSGITRGNHFHTRKIERFTVIRGKARIQLRRLGTNKIFEFELDGKNVSYIDIPIWYIHNLINVGTVDLYTQFWTNEWYDGSDPDTYFELV
jgi:UDP-2-acetamido-2,6-beta-L-arabino-hexul-4-ose reductase